MSVDKLSDLLSILDITLDTSRKRHITGGVLLSISMLFGGLAITVMTIKSEVNENE